MRVKRSRSPAHFPWLFLDFPTPPADWVLFSIRSFILFLVFFLLDWVRAPNDLCW